MYVWKTILTQLLCTVCSSFLWVINNVNCLFREIMFYSLRSVLRDPLFFEELYHYIMLRLCLQHVFLRSKKCVQIPPTFRVFQTNLSWYSGNRRGRIIGGSRALILINKKKCEKWSFFLFLEINVVNYFGKIW